MYTGPCIYCALKANTASDSVHFLHRHKGSIEVDWSYFDQFLLDSATGRPMVQDHDDIPIGQLQRFICTDTGYYKSTMVCYCHSKDGIKCSRMRGFNPACDPSFDHVDRVLIKWLLDGHMYTDAESHKKASRI